MPYFFNRPEICPVRSFFLLFCFFCLLLILNIFNCNFNCNFKLQLQLHLSSNPLYIPPPPALRPSDVSHPPSYGPLAHPGPSVVSCLSFIYLASCLNIQSPYEFNSNNPYYTLQTTDYPSSITRHPILSYPIPSSPLSLPRLNIPSYIRLPDYSALFPFLPQPILDFASSYFFGRGGLDIASRLQNETHIHTYTHIYIYIYIKTQFGI